MSLLGEVPRAILIMRDAHAWAVSGNWLDYAETDDVLIQEKRRLDEVTELLYDGYRWLLQCRDGLTDRSQYVYNSAGLTMRRDTMLYRVYASVTRSSVQVVMGGRRQWTPMLSEIYIWSKSR